MYVFQHDKKHVQIVVRGKGVLTAKNIHTDSGQALAAYVIHNLPQQAHNLTESGERATVRAKVETVIPIDLSKKKDTPSISKIVQTDGELLKLSEQTPELTSNESKLSEPKKRGRPFGSKKSDV